MSTSFDPWPQEATDDPPLDPCYRASLDALDLGYPSVPPRQDGSKAPEGFWKQYQTRLPTRQEVDDWYEAGRTGFGMVTGYAGLVCLEFDDGPTFAAYLDATAEAGLDELVERVRDGYEEESPSGGVHWLILCDDPGTNTKLAERPAPTEDDPRARKVLIETRECGGYVVCAPSHGSVHPSGRPYRLLRGGLSTIAVLTAAERDELWRLARTFDEVPGLVIPEPPPPRNGKSDGWLVRPGDDYEARATWPEVLPGWTFLPGDRLRRPGKAQGISASIRNGRLNVYSSSTSFETVLSTRRTYSKFEAFACLNHNSNLTAAAHALHSQGYGTPAEKDGHPASPRDEPDDEVPVSIRSWPDPPDEIVYHGLAGEIVRAIEPHTEADPLAVLVQLLVGFGSAVGRQPFYQIEATYHHTNENAILTGQSALGRKGTASDRANLPLAEADPEWANHRRASGLSSGEGLIFAVRDEVRGQQPIKEKGRIIDYEEVILDPGVSDKRLLVQESEFGGVLKAIQRDGNKLSALLRQAWDSGHLSTLTKSPLRASHAHISIVGHITSTELISLLSRVEAANGLANRFLWLAVRRSKVLPHGGGDVALSGLGTWLADALRSAREVGRMKMAPAARTLWESHYARLTTPPPGLLGEVTSRAAPHTIRLAMIYALMDGCATIEADHLLAALALWDASSRCAAYIFGDSLGDPDADRLLEALRAVGASGLTRKEISTEVFQKHKTSSTIARLLGQLASAGLVHSRMEPTGGRPLERWVAN